MIAVLQAGLGVGHVPLVRSLLLANLRLALIAPNGFRLQTIVGG